MSSFAEIVAADQRRVILETLAQDPDFAHNEDILAEALEYLGHSISKDKLRTELSWLQEQGLVSLQEHGPVIIARLTRRGEDVALGRTTVPGVRRRRL